VNTWKNDWLAHRLSAAICPGSAMLPPFMRMPPHLPSPTPAAQLTPALQPGAAMVKSFRRACRTPRTR